MLKRVARAARDPPPGVVSRAPLARAPCWQPVCPLPLPAAHPHRTPSAPAVDPRSPPCPPPLLLQCKDDVGEALRSAAYNEYLARTKVVGKPLTQDSGTWSTANPCQLNKV